MNFEIHITILIEQSAIPKFIEDCKNINVKPIIIETQNQHDDFGIQVMTSSKHTGENYIDVIEDIALKLSHYNILRKKIEIQPEVTKHHNHIYYESHLRLKLDKNFDYAPLKKLCNSFNLHLSKNLFKKDENFIWQMITYRNTNTDFETFDSLIKEVAFELKNMNIFCDKIEIEECIFDTNEMIDNSWIN